MSGTENTPKLQQGSDSVPRTKDKVSFSFFFQLILRVNLTQQIFRSDDIQIIFQRA